MPRQNETPPAYRTLRITCVTTPHTSKSIASVISMGGKAPLSATKFLFVVLWFMHLKFDNRLFSILFGGGFALALTILAVALSTIGGQLV